MSVRNSFHPEHIVRSCRFCEMLQMRGVSVFVGILARTLLCCTDHTCSSLLDGQRLEVLLWGWSHFQCLNSDSHISVLLWVASPAGSEGAAESQITSGKLLYKGA